MSSRFARYVRRSAICGVAFGALTSLPAVALVVTATSGTGGQAIRYPGGTGIVHVTVTNDSGSALPANTLIAGAVFHGGVAGVTGCGGTNWSCTPSGPVYSVSLAPGQTTDVLTVRLAPDITTAITNSAQCAVAGASAPCAGGVILVAPPYSSNVVTGYFTLIPAGLARWIRPGDGSWSDPMSWLGGPPMAGESVLFHSSDAGSGDHLVTDIAADVNSLEVNGTRVKLVTTPATGWLGSSAMYLYNGSTLTFVGRFSTSYLEVRLGNTAVIDGGEVEVFFSAGSGIFGTLIARNSGILRTRFLFLGQPLPGGTIELKEGGVGSGKLYAGYPEPSEMNSLADGDFGVFGWVAAPDYKPWPCPEQGTINGNLIITRATFSPGCSPGTHVVHGDYVQDSASTLRIELGASESDQLVVEGTAYLAGKLEIAGADEPSQIQSLDVPFLQAGSVAGNFEEVSNTSGVIAAVDPVNGTIQTRGVARCSNGIDDDGDGTLDFDGGALANGGTPLGQPDRQCYSPSDNSERRDCGVGAELAFVLPLLAWLDGRRRRGPCAPAA